MTQDASSALTTREWVLIAGWFVTFALGIISTGFIVPRLTKKRKILAWAVVSEGEIIPRDLSEWLGVPVFLQVGDERPNSLSGVLVRLGNGGNEVIENVAAAISFNSEAVILNVRSDKELGEYSKHVTWKHAGNTCTVECAFINPGQNVELELLISEYQEGSANVDAAAPGLAVRRRDPMRWEMPIPPLHSVGLSLFGIRYDPSAASTAEIAEEIRAIRLLIQRPK
jgi:hypothetical protein